MALQIALVLRAFGDDRVGRVDHRLFERAALRRKLVVRLVHAPHVAGLSREGKMQVYVSAGTGTWGPPVRFGTSPELTLLTLKRA